MKQKAGEWAVAADRLLILAAGTCGGYETERKPRLGAQPPCPEFLGREEQSRVACKETAIVAIFTYRATSKGMWLLGSIVCGWRRMLLPVSPQHNSHFIKDCKSCLRASGKESGGAASGLSLSLSLSIRLRAEI